MMEISVIDVFMLGVIVGELLMAAVIISMSLYLNKKRYGVFVVPKNIRRYARLYIRDQLKKENCSFIDDNANI